MRPSHRPSRSRPARRAAVVAGALAAAIPLGACAEGGDEDRPQCEVEVQADHHFFALVSRPQFAEFPTTSNDTTSFEGTLALQAGCSYELLDSAGTRVSTLDYALSEEGALSLLVPGRTTVIFRGGYGRAGDTGHVFLTDRVGSDVGLYWGTRVVEGPADRAAFAGDWHVFSLHAVFVAPNTPPDPDSVGLAFGGSLELMPDGSFSGTGVESEAGSIAISGAADDFQAFADGRIGMEITFDPTNKPDYQRGFAAGGTPQAVFGVDGDFGGNDDATGLFVMLKQRDPATFDLDDLAGVYRLGFYTLFLRPDASGSDSAIGTLELTANGDFELIAQNNTGDDFRYRGSFTATPEGMLEFTVSGTDETWSGAFDAGYDTVVILDRFKETRSNGQIELSIGLGLRPSEATSGS